MDLIFGFGVVVGWVWGAGSVGLAMLLGNVFRKRETANSLQYQRQLIGVADLVEAQRSGQLTARSGEQAVTFPRSTR
jgi:hypothetical protein